MKFYSVTPINDLALTEVNDNYFCIAPFCVSKFSSVEDDKLTYKLTPYGKFFKKKAAEGKSVILNTGITENNLLPLELYIKVIQMIHPTEVIVPDILYDSNGTVLAKNQFKSVWFEYLKGEGKKYFRNGNTPSLIGIPQGKENISWMQSLFSMLEDPYIKTVGLSKFSIPVAFKSLGTGVRQTRTTLVQILAKLGLAYKPFHLLGMRDPAEFVLYNKLGYYKAGIVRSCSSCFPVLTALYHNTLQTADFTQGTPENFFDIILDTVARVKAKVNIIRLNEVAGVSIDSLEEERRFNKSAN